MKITKEQQDFIHMKSKKKVGDDFLMYRSFDLKDENFKESQHIHVGPNQYCSYLFTVEDIVSHIGMPWYKCSYYSRETFEKEYCHLQEVTVRWREIEVSIFYSIIFTPCFWVLNFFRRLCK